MARTGDDIKLAANDVDIRSFGSQGQQRSAVLSLKLAEIELFKEKTGETPVLLLDDVLSELDDTRKDALFKRPRGHTNDGNLHRVQIPTR